jgi:hypothetical protein
MAIVYVRPFVLSSMAKSEAQVASFRAVNSKYVTCVCNWAFAILTAQPFFGQAADWV